MRHIWIFCVFLIGCGGQILFLRELEGDAAPQWLRVAIHIAPWLLVMLGENPAGPASAQRLRAAGCLMYLMFDAAAVWLMVSRGMPEGHRISLPLMVPATVSAILMVRDLFRAPPKLHMSPRLEGLIHREADRRNPDREAIARALFLSFLGMEGANGKRNAALLTEAIGDESPLVRFAVAEALGRLGPDAAAAEPALTELQKDADEDVGEAVEEALRRIRAVDAEANTPGGGSR